MQQRRGNSLADHAEHTAPVLAFYKGASIHSPRFQSDIAALCAKLQQRDETRWGLYCDDSYIFAVSLIALLHCGRTPVVLPNMQPEFIESISGHFDALLTDRVQDKQAIGTLHVSADTVPAAGGAAPVLLDKIGGSVVIFTSGSTGEPKKIEKRWQQLINEIDVLEQSWGKQLADARIMSTVSHQHIYGLLFKVLWPLFSGRSFDSATYQYPEPLLEQMTKLPAVVLISSPAHLKRIPQMVDLAAMKSRLLAIFSSGGPLPNDAAVGIAQTLDIGVIEVFGSTETGGVAWRSQRQAGEIVPWTPLPRVDIRPDPEDSCLLIRSPFEGSGGWHKMGDIVELAELEAKLAASDLIAEAVATVLDGHRHSVAVAAVLSPAGLDFLERQGHKEICARLREYLSGYFEAVVLPKKWRFVAQMPVNSQGKITQSAVKQLFLSTEPVSDAAFTTQPTIESIEHRADGIVLNLRIATDLIYFNGHFADRAVLPGVAQLAWAHAFGKQYLSVSGDFQSLEAVKFHRFIEPGDSIRLNLSYHADKGKLVFSYESEQGTHSSGRLVMRS
jgi:acyl-CoA synthetase (AMP-forming)/AMP-acid ligase II